MKKNLFLCMLAAAGMLFATSCSTNEPEAPSGGDARVAFSLDLEGATQTRAISDGSSATKLVYAVYKIEGDNATLLKMLGSDENSQLIKEDFNPAGDEVSLMLAKGQTYTAVFWAQHPDCNAYTTTDLTNVTVDYAGINNDETRDAFFKAETFTVNGDAMISVTLKRPFAQINVGTMPEDWEAAVAAGVKIVETKAEIKAVATSINLLDGVVSGETDVTYEFAAIPEEVLLVETDAENEGKESYNWLSMSYILASADKTTADMQFTFKPESGREIVAHDGLTSVPVQRNWRTNILGNFLLDNVIINIVVDPAYDGDLNYDYPELDIIADGVSFDAASKTYYLSSKKGLTWLQKQTKSFAGYTVKLTADVVLGTWKPIANFNGTFDGGNYTVRDMKVATDKGASAGFFASAVGGTVKNLRMENVTVAGDYKAGAIVGDGLCARIENCHVDGGTITSVPRLVAGKYVNANNVGGITGYLSAEPAAWVKDCTVSNLQIMAYRDVGGVVGTTTGDGSAPVVSGNTVSNVTVIANQLSEYGEVKEPNAGQFIGRNLASVDESTNTAENVQVNVLTIDNVVEDGTITVGEGVPFAAVANLANSGNVENIVLSGDVEGPATAANPYGRKNGINLPAGVSIDGGEHSLKTNDAYYVIAAHGGTIRNFSAIEGGERGIVTYAPTEDVIIENVVIDQPGYAINTAENTKVEGLKLIVRNSTLNGWSSWAGGFASAEFTNCHFGENSTHYWQNYGNPAWVDRLMRPYITTTFTNCTLQQDFYISLETLKDGTRIVFDQCTVNGTVLTADNYADLVTFLLDDQTQAGLTVESFVDFR